MVLASWQHMARLYQDARERNVRDVCKIWRELCSCNAFVFTSIEPTIPPYTNTDNEASLASNVLDSINTDSLVCITIECVSLDLSFDEFNQSLTMMMMIITTTMTIVVP